MTKKEFLLLVKEKDVTPEILEQRLNEVLAEERKEVHTAYDNAFKSAGFEKENGMQSITHVENVIKGLKSKAENSDSTIEGLNKKIEEITAKAPRVEEINKAWEDKLTTQANEFQKERDSWKAERLNSSISSISSDFKYAEQFANVANDIFETKKNAMLSKFSTENHEGELALKSGESFVRNDKGQVVLVKDYLANEMKEFMMQKSNEGGTPPPKKPSGSSGTPLKTTEEKIAYAKENGINILSAAGQAELAKLSE